MYSAQNSAAQLAAGCIHVRRQKRANWLTDNVRGFAGRTATSLRDVASRLPPELIGAGLGAGIGAIIPPVGTDASSRRENRLRRMMIGGLAGGGAGAAYRYGTQGLPAVQPASLPESARQLEQAKAEAAKVVAPRNDMQSAIDDVRTSVRWPGSAALPPSQAYAAGATGWGIHEAIANKHLVSPSATVSPSSALGLRAIRLGLGSQGNASAVSGLNDAQLKAVIESAARGETAAEISGAAGQKLPGLLDRLRGLLSRGKTAPVTSRINHGLTNQAVLDLVANNTEAAKKMVPSSAVMQPGIKNTLARGAAWMAIPWLYDQYVRTRDAETQRQVLNATQQHIFGK